MRQISTIHLKSPKIKIAWGIIFILAFVYIIFIFAKKNQVFTQGISISLSFLSLLKYSFYSLSRMSVAYVFSFIFSLVYGYIAAYHKRAETILIPLLDVLQSVPILSFLPVTLLAFTAFLPQKIAVELASIVLIFTSQVWNLTFAWYQSLITIPKELKEASRIFRFNWWLKLKYLELPFGAINLIWNSMMSWAGGWFFLMAAEMFTVGNKDFRLPGLGSYLQVAANRKDLHAIFMGILALVLIIVTLDQLIWRPLLSWAEKFKLDNIEEKQPSSWFYDFLKNTKLFQKICALWDEFIEKVDLWSVKKWAPEQTKTSKLHVWIGRILLLSFIIFIIYEAVRSLEVMITLPSFEWKEVGEALIFTTLRVFLALFFSFLWTVPVGVFIGRNERASSLLQPIVQIVASIPATAFFPVLLLIFLHLPGGLNVASILLMMAGTQWYILFNVIAGASSIPKDLEYTTQLLHLSRFEKWKTLILPAIFPYLVTGGIAAAGGAWNASIVAEYIKFGGKILKVKGLGELISQTTADGNYTLLLTSTVVMIIAVVLINKFVWKSLYNLAREKYSLE